MGSATAPIPPPAVPAATQAPERPPQAWAGLLVPGLGHLLSGEAVTGVGLLFSTTLVLASAVNFPRLLSRFAAYGTPDFAIHPYVALVSWCVAAIWLWRAALRFAKPPPVDLAKLKESQLAQIRRQFQRNRTGVLGMYMVVAMLLLALLTPFLAPFDPNELDAGPQLAAPGGAWLLGTDEFGRDLFSRVLYGARISLSIGFVAVSIAGTIGTLLGAISGFFGGFVDKAIMWLTDLLLSLPRLVLLLAIIGIVSAAGAQTIFLIVFILGLTGWMGVCRIVRSQVLSLKEQDFVAAARAVGLGDWRILLRHIVPNALAPVIVYVSLAIGTTILVEASLSFLGLGVPPPTSTWGAIVNDGREYLRTAWWITLFPGLMIVLAVMSFNLFGDGLRDALDPKLRGRG